MARLLVEHDAQAKRSLFLHTDTDEKYVLESVQDCDGFSDYNKLVSEGLNKKARMWHVGTIPLQVCQQWADESGTKVFSREWQEYAKKQMNSSEYRNLNQAKVRI